MAGANNALKTPFARSLTLAAQEQVAQALRKLGQALPCSIAAVNANNTVTVNFELISPYTLPQITIPISTYVYIRVPIQVGDLGWVLPASVYLGGVSGLGGGTADLSQPANLAALVYFPISNTGWSSVDPNAVTIYGPNGVVLRNSASTSSLVLTPAGIALIGQDTVTITVGSTVFTLTPTSYTITGVNGVVQGTDTLYLADAVNYTDPSLMGTAYMALITWLNLHTHNDVQTGGDISGVPTAAYAGSNIALPLPFP